LELVAEGNTEFALDLYARLRNESGNLFLSPYSISTALAMTYAGARGETAGQMADVLHFSLEQERLHPAFAELESSVKAAGGGSGCKLDVANALWGQQGYRFLEQFLTLTRKHYNAGFREVDFVGATEQARQVINTWVAERTRQMIRELLRKGDLDPADALVLTNAIYFKGDWASRFDVEHTQNGSFRIGENDEVIVPMMYQLGRFAFAAGDELDVLELPYDGDRLSMVFLLPKKVDGLAALEESLNRENLNLWLGRLREQPVRVSLPRFKLGYRIDLARTLEAMGMIDAFRGGKADFSGMTGRRDLFIGMVMHEARVEVTEEGTEAAAATGVKMKGIALPAAFVADHPFLFLIRDKQTGSILFIGRVVNPTA
jgi:serpin B